jgi:S-adenosylmethionine:tRNA ribosyltransferase-isomerase
VHRQDFAYDLPPELIAQTPSAERSGSRLLLLDGASGSIHDSQMRALPENLRAGDLLVVNDTRVIAARLIGTKPTGGQVEIFLERVLENDEALAQISASKPVRAGLTVSTPGGAVQVLARESDLWRIGLPGPTLEFFERHGEVPLPPYIRRAPGSGDRERYQSIFARAPGAVAAPTASLHFDAELIAALEARGIERTRVTLHVGAGTFQPVRVDDLEQHVLHAERATVDAEACAAIARTRARGGRIVAVGTTVVRALESAALAGGDDDGPRAGVPMPWSGETRLFIRPGFRFRVIDRLLTNFHLPESTLLMLVCAFAGTRHVLKAYRHAVAARYRFFSYGDAMLVSARAHES